MKFTVTLIMRSFVRDSNKCSNALVSKVTSGRSSQIKPPNFVLKAAGAGFSCTSRQKSLTVFLFFLIVELSESFECSDEYDGFGGGIGTLFRWPLGNNPGKGGGSPTGGRKNPGGGGGGPFPMFAAGDNRSSSESWRRSEKSKSQRWNSLLRHPCLSSSQCNSFSETLISCTFGDFSMLGLLITSTKGIKKYLYCIQKIKPFL